MENYHEWTSLDTLTEALDTHPDVVVTFSRAAGCIPCARFAPHFQAAAEQVPGTLFVKFTLDESDDFSEVVDKFNIASTPTVIRFRGSETVNVESRTVVSLTKELENG